MSVVGFATVNEFNFNFREFHLSQSLGMRPKNYGYTEIFIKSIKLSTRITPFLPY